MTTIQSAFLDTVILSKKSDIETNIYYVRSAFKNRNWTNLAPVTRNYILQNAQRILEMEEVDSTTKLSIREERQTALSVMRQGIENALNIRY